MINEAPAIPGKPITALPTDRRVAILTGTAGGILMIRVAQAREAER